MHFNHILLITLFILIITEYIKSSGPNHLEEPQGNLNCSIAETIKLQEDALLPNGSYIYKNQTIIPPNLMGNFDLDILNNNGQRPQYKRACICHLRSCMTFCSQAVPEFFYERDINLSINVTLRNHSVVLKNIAEDFERYIKKDFCKASDDLVKEVDTKLGWTLFENGSLLVHSSRKQLNRTEYCFDFHKTVYGDDDYNMIIPRFCQKKEVTDTLMYLYYWTQVISLIFLLLTMAVYCYVPELHTLHGKCFITYVGSLALFLAIYTFMHLSKISINFKPCLFIAYLNYYLKLFHYMWMVILCYNIWRNLSNLEYKSSYLKYASYGYTLPLAIVLLVSLLPKSHIYQVIQNDRCYLYAHKWFDLFYLYGPPLITIIVSLILIVLTLRLLKMKYNEIYEKLSLKDSPEKRYTPYLHLFYVMVLCWVFGNLADIFYMSNYMILSFIASYIKSLQGLCIFIIFIVRQKILHMIQRTYYEN